MKQELIEKIEGYDRVVTEMEICRKFGMDYSVEKGQVQEYISRLHPERLRLTVSDIIAETPSAKTLRLISPGATLPPFQAGQYLAVFCDIGKVRTGRAYSISSPPSHLGYFDITIRGVENGFVSNYLLKEVKAGDTIETSGPSGNFYINPLIHDKSLVFLGGGSGITPFMSMIRETAECGIPREITLFYGNKSLDDVIFHDELLKISKSRKNIRYISVIENPEKGYKGACGYINGDLLKKELGGVKDKTFFICGPTAMYNFCIPELEGLSIPKHKIRREMYGAPKGISSHKGWPSKIKESDTFEIGINSSKRIKASAGEPLLNSLERNGIVVPSLCRSGECSMCRVKLVSGKVFQPEGVLVRKSDRTYGYIHSCAAYPLENCEILI